ALKRGKPRVCIGDGVYLQLVDIWPAGLPVIRVSHHQAGNADLERLEHERPRPDGVSEVLSTILDYGQSSSWEDKRSEVGKRTLAGETKREGSELLDSFDIERLSKHVGTVRGIFRSARDRVNDIVGREWRTVVERDARPKPDGPRRALRVVWFDGLGES